MYERLNELHRRFLERLMRLYTSILKDEIAEHQKDRIEIITNAPKPRTATENREAVPDMRQKIQDALDELKKQDSVELPSITGSGWHNPENVTQEQLGEGYRFLVPWEVDGRYGCDGSKIAECWDDFAWDRHCSAEYNNITYRVPASTPIPPKP